MSNECIQQDVPPMISDNTPKLTREWAILIPALTLPFFGSLVYFNILSGTKFAMVFYTAVKLFTLVFPAIIWFAIRQRPAVGKIERTRSIFEGALSGVVICGFLLVAFVFTPLGDEVLRHRGTIFERMSGLGVANYYIPFCVFLAIAHSLLEEYYWRWFVWKRLDKIMPGIRSHLLAALGFALHHYVVLAGFFGLKWSLLFGTLVGVGGFIWSLQYKRTGSLLGSWLSHLLVDAITFGVGYFIVFG